jgi:hypothetical protein
MEHKLAGINYLVGYLYRNGPPGPKRERMITIFTICSNNQWRCMLCVCGFCMILPVNGDYFFNSINHLNSVMVKCGLLFEVDW